MESFRLVLILASIFFGAVSAISWRVMLYVKTPKISIEDIYPESYVSGESLQCERTGVFHELKGVVFDFPLILRWRSEIKKYKNSYSSCISFTTRLNKVAAVSAMFSVLLLEGAIFIEWALR